MPVRDGDEGIDRVWDMEQEECLIGLWPGYSSDDWVLGDQRLQIWGSAKRRRFLWAADRPLYTVPN